MTNRTVHIALDLGSDTIKVAYAFHDGKDFTGKIVGDPLAMTAIPSVAYYDVDDRKWLFGDEVDSVGDKPFLTVVKICDLLRLLQPTDDEATHKSNMAYYRNKNRFPKFYFPQRSILTEDMAASERLDMTFAADDTPRRVCELFFEYVFGIVKKRLTVLFRGKCETITVVPCLVYPAFSDGEYTQELKRLVAAAFGTAPKTVMSMAKALCAYAKYSGRMNKTDRSVIFNIGEERTSLVKVSFSGGGISIDGADGHNPPAAIGGKDIDDAVARYIEGQISGRETMGRPSSGEDGHIAESALNTKQYLFVKDIKTAKIVLGMPIYESRAFSSGVPISASRDLLVQRYITRKQFEECVGITGSNGIAEQFVDYITEELARPINSDVKKIFITGGPVETYGLIPYIRARLSSRGIDVLTFEKPDADYVGVENDGFNIMSHEDALYAPALGCAVASMCGMTIDTVLALSYGVRLFRNIDRVSIPFFKLLVDKGTRIPQSGATYTSPDDYSPVLGNTKGISTGKKTEQSAPLHIFSTFFSQEDIRHSRLAPIVTYRRSDGENLLLLDTENRGMIKKLREKIGLRVLNGDIDDLREGAYARYFHNGRPIKLIDEVCLQFGVKIDGDGYAKTFAKNDRSRNGSSMVAIEYLDGRGGAAYDPGDIFGGYNRSGSSGNLATVPASEIELRLNIETQLT